MRPTKQLLITLALATIFAPRIASACGGCFAPPAEQTTVDSHRMVIALRTDETILWDQIVYSGNPQDFVWVLPVPTPDVDVEVAAPEFFAGLDQGTAPTIQPLSPPPRTSCGGGGVGCGAGGSAGAAGEPADNVTIYNEDTVGPYETVTIGAQDPNALYSWLNSNGYAVDASVVPTLEHYINQQNVFIAMRLQPGVGVQAMQPVRIRYKSFMSTFPLKMVAVGARGELELALWIIAEQRYEGQNYGAIELNKDYLYWDWSTSRSNYADAFRLSAIEAGNRAWIVESAGPLADATSAFPAEATLDLNIARGDSIAPYLTRLRTIMLIDHIDEDMLLAPAQNAGNVSRFLFAPNDLNRPPGVQCDDSGCVVTTGRRGNAGLAMFLLVLGGLVLSRRARRRKVQPNR